MYQGYNRHNAEQRKCEGINLYTHDLSYFSPSKIAAVSKCLGTDLWRKHNTDIMNGHAGNQSTHY